MDSNSFAGDYEVFLSFRGEDTRQGFTDVLYEYLTSAGIRVFRDDDELSIGEEIESILKAIDSSKICIVVFSKHFAESKWCLREVARMVEKKKLIVPLFYKVSPDDVKLKETSVYADDFKKFEQNHGDPVEIQKWKDALRKAAENKGRELRNERYTQFCKVFVNEILSKLGPRIRLDIDDHFVGDTNKAAAIRLLDMAGSTSQEVIYLGIHGMGGVGKTTLTKLIYNEFSPDFEYCGFLSDIRETSVNKGVDYLPTYLYEHLQPKPLIKFSQSGQISNLFRKKKVLLILDDVGSDEQIRKIARQPSWFGSGSKIILTSRDTEVFKDFESASGCAIQYLEMKELERDWSLELFSRCTFGNSSPPSSFRDLSEKVVAYAGGLPLAITVIAKRLRDKKEVVWKEVIQKLKKSPFPDVKTRLLISYDSLEDEQKEIFLDIACSFDSFLFTYSLLVDSMWEACELYPSGSLGVLQSRSLIKIVQFGFGDDFVIEMHDQLRELGRDIVRAKSGGNIMKQSRLWKGNEVEELVLKCKEKEKKRVEALNLDGRVLLDEDLVSFDNLRSLVVWKLKGDFSNLFPELRYLECWEIIEARNLAPPNLVMLKLAGSDVDENCDVWSQIPKLRKLKSLNLSFCWKLRETPVFPENRPLERLDLNGCEHLEYIDTSIGKLRHLTKLNLDGCKNLKKLPESCGELHALRELNLSGTNISLPDSIGRLKKLEMLNLSFNHQKMKLTKPPTSLKVLRIDCGGVNNVPDLSSLQDLTSLSEVITNNILDIGEMQSLTSLTIEECPSLVSLVNLDKLKQLRTLLFMGCPSLSQIPGLGKLQGLSKLTIIHCDSLELIDDITGLDELIELNLISCPKLTKITGLVNLKSLRIFRVYNSCESREILKVASQLKKLYGVEVQEIPDWFAWAESRSEEGTLATTQILKKLKALSVSNCPSLRSTPVFSRNMHLERLNLSQCNKLEYIDPSIGKLQHLTYLDLSGGKLKNLPDSIGGLVKLRKLNLDHTRFLVRIPESLGNLHSLQELNLSASGITRLPNSIISLEKLEKLDLSYCEQLQELPKLPSSLKVLYIGCGGMKDNPNLSNLQGLTSLKIDGARFNLSDSDIGFSSMSRSLLSLTLIKCEVITDIPDIGKLQSLTSLTIQECPSLVRISGVGKLQSLFIQECPSFFLSGSRGFT